MAGINLSQTLQEKQAKARGKFFDTGFFINFALLLLTMAVYWGAQWYLSSLDGQLDAIKKKISEQTAQLEGKEAQRVMDFRDRLDFIKKNLVTSPDSPRIFKELESATVSDVRLTLYEENWRDGKVAVEGVTGNMKYVAQLMLSIKKNPLVQEVSVDGLRINDEDLWEFELSAKTVNASQK